MRSNRGAVEPAAARGRAHTRAAAPAASPLAHRRARRPPVCVLARQARTADCAGCSHCVDLRHMASDDPPPLRLLRAEVATHVRRWLEEGAASYAGEGVPWRGSLQELPVPY